MEISTAVVVSLGVVKKFIVGNGLLAANDASLPAMLVAAPVAGDRVLLNCLNC